jgi:hypothetical protein
MNRKIALAFISVFLVASMLSSGCTRINPQSTTPEGIKTLNEITQRIRGARPAGINSASYEIVYVLPEEYYLEAYYEEGMQPALIPTEHRAKISWQRGIGESWDKFRIEIRSVYSRERILPIFEINYAVIGSNSTGLWIMQNESVSSPYPSDNLVHRAYNLLLRLMSGGYRMWSRVPQQVIAVEPSPYLDAFLQMGMMLNPYALLENVLPLIGMGIQVEYLDKVELDGKDALKYKLLLDPAMAQQLVSVLVGGMAPAGEELQPGKNLSSFESLGYIMYLDEKTWFPVQLDLFEEDMLITSIQIKNFKINPLEKDMSPEEVIKFFEVPEGIRVINQPMKTPYDFNVFVQRMIQVFLFIAPAPA